MTRAPVVVELTARELVMPATVGLHRWLYAVEANLNRGPHPKDGACEDHVRGAIGEYVLSRFLGFFWGGTVGMLDQADVRAFQVRTTHHDNGRLIIKPADSDVDVFVLVTGDKLRYTIQGYMSAVEARQSQWWDDTSPWARGRGAHFVPQSALYDVNDLRGFSS